jgi:hypothetical protein
MEQVIRIQGFQESQAFSGSEAVMARVQDETFSSRKKLTFESIQTSTSSATASLACLAGVALVTTANVTAGVDDFMSQRLSEITCGVESAVKKWDIRSQLLLISQDFITQPQSNYETTNVTISDLISFVRNHVPLTYSASLANRLEYLREASIEEAPEQASISENSLQAFVSFITGEPRLSEPDVVLTYTGNIRAEWHKSRKEHFAVEFLPNGQVRYVVFSRDPVHAKRTDRASGQASAETLMAKVKPFHVLAWARS